MRKREFLGISLFFIIGGLSMIAIGILYMSSNDYFELKENGAVAEGRVISYQLTENDGDGLHFLFMPFAYIAYQTIDINSYWVEVKFTDESGETYQFRNDFALSASKAAMRDRLEVYYLKENPSNAIVYDFFYFYGVPLLLTLTGSVMVAMGAFAYRF